MMTQRLRQRGWKVNRKKVSRFMSILGLKIKCKAKKRRRLGISSGKRQQACYPNHVWSWDIIYDQTSRGRQLRILTVLDEYTRECYSIQVGYHMTSCEVLETLKQLVQQHGMPEHIRSDNGSEFIAKAVQVWIKTSQIATLYITPGSPWENPYIESFHGKFRDECLNRELFDSLLEAQIIIEDWRNEYNQERPHSSLGYQTPFEFKKTLCNPPVATLPTGCIKHPNMMYTNITSGTNNGG